MIGVVYGVGINDADYTVKPKQNGIQTCCPYYLRWQGMLLRAYSADFHSKHPSYIGTSVCKEWLSFMNFKKWMKKQEWENKELDKDIIYPNNKVYSPKTCVFVSTELNRLLTAREAKRGKYKKGVSWNKVAKKFHAQISIHGKRKNLGLFIYEEDAHKAYIMAKIEHIESFYDGVHNNVVDGLKRHVQSMRDSLKE